MSGRWVLAVAIAPGVACAAPKGWPSLPTREECEAVLTVQKANCDVEHVYLCPAGVQFTHIQIAANGTEIFGHGKTPVTGWTVEERDNRVFLLFSDVSPFLEIDDVLAGRVAPQGGRVFMWTPLFVDPMIGTFESDFLTDGEQVVIDDAPLVKFRWGGSFSFNGGLLEFRSEGDVFVSPRLGVSFSGETEDTIFGKPVPDTGDTSPAALILPGEAGFLAAPDPMQCLQLGSLPPLATRGRA